MSMSARLSLVSVLTLVLVSNSTAVDRGAPSSGDVPEGFEELFNGRDFSGWRVPQGDGGHWQVVDGVIDYDALSEAAGDKSLWSEEEFGDYVLRIDWRIKDVSVYVNPHVPIILPDGSHKRDAAGNEILMSVPDSDSGIFPRGHAKGQANIWNWPVGSGEVYGYRMDRGMPSEVRAAATPLVNADRHIGEWNTFEITVQGEHMTVVLNDHLVIDRVHLMEIPERGPIGLQHHGHLENGVWASPPSLVQFRNVFVKRLD